MWRKHESNEVEDCLECRIVGGLSISMIGIYIWSQAKRRKGLERSAIQMLSCGAFGVGFARMFNFIPSLSKTNDK